MSVTFTSTVKSLQRELAAYDKKRIKAYQTAVKVEGYRLSRVFKEEVSAARPGGRKLTPLSQIARRTKTGRLRKNARKPLASLAHLVRYNSTIVGNQQTVDVGFVNPKMDTRSWKKLVNLHQEGGAADILYRSGRRELGRRMASIGGRLKKAGDPDARFFFLRKNAGRDKGALAGMMIPARSEVDPFWDVHQKEAENKILLNFHRKMQGERI